MPPSDPRLCSNCSHPCVPCDGPGGCGNSTYCDYCERCELHPTKAPAPVDPAKARIAAYEIACETVTAARKEHVAALVALARAVRAGYAAEERFENTHTKKARLAYGVATSEARVKAEAVGAAINKLVAAKAARSAALDPGAGLANEEASP